ncbi:MAG TPA: hypothetical protein VFF43_17670 [Caldimonas sp.]|jgi:hypothetical protein|nr:hypothetical protein [Caldimonas sp.]
MHSPFVDSASFLSEGFDRVTRSTPSAIRLLAFALVTAVAASSAVLLAI